MNKPHLFVAVSVRKNGLGRSSAVGAAASGRGTVARGRDAYLLNESAEPADRISWLCTCE